MKMNENPLRIAVIGQSNFAADVLELLLEYNYVIVGIFTIPDKGHREDILATTAKRHNIPTFKIATWRNKSGVLNDVLTQYKSVSANLNVLPYCSKYIPIEIIDGAQLGSLCYHPSILPRHRGASAISWTLIDGDPEAGFSIFWADDGLDTGPILLQKQCKVEATDTLDLLYKRFLYPEGVKGMAEAVRLVANGKAPKIRQIDFNASYDAAIFKEDNQYINLNQSAKNIWNFIRGLDSNPGALALVLHEDGTEEKIRLFGASIYNDNAAISCDQQLRFKGLQQPALITRNGLLIPANDGLYVNVKRVKRGFKVINASDWFLPSEQNHISNFTTDELDKREILRSIWNSILKCPIEDQTDFFAAGATSMDVIRLTEECKESLDVQLQNQQIFMAPIFDEYFLEIVKIMRHGSNGGLNKIHYDGFVLQANKRSISIPTQLFINGEFTDAENRQALDIINPSNEEVLCKVACASAKDIDKAVEAAFKAFHGPWRQISARERGGLMLKLAGLMEEHKEELATIESVDSGAVYTVALKTHIGMSIDVWRYFAGWCDKIQGNTIPVNPARPNNILTFTKKEPIGVVGLITPWNYPLMMLSWKMAACIAAGNTCLIKPAQTCPLTALKFAELTVKAGFPPGVINIVPGRGSDAGQAIANHRLIRKLGFTGSTEVGKMVMRSCATSNLKKCSLELGGKSPLIIFADCDLDKAIKHGMSSVFFNKGENCIAAGRLFIEDSIHDDFIRGIRREIRAMSIGDPLNRSTSHGPQNHRAHFEKLIEFCQRGITEGATLVCGGKPVPNTKGYFFEPTVFTDVEDHMYIAQEESFGPIMICSKFHGSDIGSVLSRANRSEYGLASGVFTRDIGKALLFADSLAAGTVFINVYNKTDVAAPFGGYKQSGFGKDLGQQALDEYLNTKCITIEY